MNENELKKRTKQFGLRVIKLVEALPTGQTPERLKINCSVRDYR